MGPRRFNCGKNEHIKRDCRQPRENSKENLKRKKKKKAFCTDKMPVGSSRSKNDQVVGLFAHHALSTNNEKSSWIVYSERRVVCITNKFVNFTKLDVAEDITLVNGHSVEALEIGTLEFVVSVSDRKQQRCRLYETLYVTKLSYNLLSVSRATRSSKSFIFTESCCRLLK